MSNTTRTIQVDYLARVEGEGSLTIRLDALPVNGMLQVRDPDERDRERDRANGNGNGASR